MQLKNITEKELDCFVRNCPYGHFMHTSAWADVARSRGQIPHLLGLYEGTELKGTALLLEKKIFRWSTFYIPRGFAIDYQDRELLRQMLSLLKKYVHAHAGLYFRFDPEILWHVLDENAQRKKSYPENEELISFFRQEGAVWKGETIRFTEMSNPRFTFRVPLQNDLLAQCHPTTRKILNRQNPFHIEIYKGDEHDLKYFYRVMSDTARQKGIYLEPFSYFENFYKLLAKKDMADIWVAKINVTRLKETYRSKIAALEAEIALADSPEATKKQKAKKNDLLAQCRKWQTEEKELETISEEEIILSSIINARFKDTVATVHGGNNEQLRNLSANYELYYRILADAQKQGYQWGDLFGTEGRVDPKSEVYGIYLFKLRFGGDYDEYIGEFDIKTRRFISFLIEKALHFRRKWLIAHQDKEKKS